MMGETVRYGGQSRAPFAEPLTEGFLLIFGVEEREFRQTAFLKVSGNLRERSRAISRTLVNVDCRTSPSTRCSLTRRAAMAPPSE